MITSQKTYKSTKAKTKYSMVKMQMQTCHQTNTGEFNKNSGERKNSSVINLLHRPPSNNF